MKANNAQTDHESGDQNGSDAGEENDDDAEDDEDAEGLALGESAPEDDERRIGGAEEVEKDPGGKEREEEEERERVGEEREGEGHGDEGKVVDSEVGVVFADAEGGIGEGVGAGESGAVDKLGPGAALSEAVAHGIGDVADKCADGRSGHRRLRLRGRSGGLCIRKRKNRRSQSRHGRRFLRKISGMI